VAKKVKVFVDSDIVISSQLSNIGAAYFLLNKTNLSLFVSNLSLVELQRVATRHKINNAQMLAFIKKRFSHVNLTEEFKEIESQFNSYANDPNDIHVIAGAVRANVNFLLTYNLKDYKIDKIKMPDNGLLLEPINPVKYAQIVAKKNPITNKNNTVINIAHNKKTP